jgi:phenylalanyl-tRNA synthetase alpha chain
METQLTADMLRTGDWKNVKMKKVNLNAAGQVTNGGHLHPLLKVRTQFRQTLIEMGFNEMPTDKFVESGFWNFDSLFQPQSHPARDMHDTFFLKNPVSCNHVPQDYMEKVKSTHEDGLPGSFGYGKGWSLEESKKNILRTHTTAISSQMLYKLAQEQKQTGQFKPMKYFSIDRVFRNETLDATHLAEFHQVEGLIIDKNIGLSNLLGVMHTFFRKIGMKNLKFKPAYNPYTEPSLEIFAFHPMLNRWVEIGNSGVFRPEMLEPMGFEKDVGVIAWGLSLERPTMIYYGINNIRDMVGSKVSLQSMKENPVCLIQQQEHA